MEWQGNAVKKREDVHRMAEANRAFALRWSHGEKHTDFKEQPMPAFMP